MKQFFTLLLLLASLSAFAQVDQIRSASSSQSTAKSSGSSSGSEFSGGSIFGDLIFNFMIGGVVDAQIQRLERKREMPQVIGLDLWLQTAIQPGSYYIVTPRVRGTWGLFSTDFRKSMLIEEGVDGIEYIATNDWQVIQLNLLAIREVTWRVGGGFSQETFGGNNHYGEWTTAIHVHPEETAWGGLAEYRGAEMRQEVAGFAHYKLFDRNLLHGYATGGLIWQRHYDIVTTWGVQMGFMLRVF